MKFYLTVRDEEASETADSTAVSKYDTLITLETTCNFRMYQIALLAYLFPSLQFI